MKEALSLLGRITRRLPGRHSALRHSGTQTQGG